jgi:cytoskeletal protein CcmA (bactofilin family)
MFNKNKKTSKAKETNGTSPTVNLLCEEAMAKGDIHVNNDIRIAGKLEGDLTAKGKTIITSTGVLDGNILGVYADIAGTVNGEIRISDKIVIRESAIINGKVFTKNLLVEDGAQFEGTLCISQEKEENQLGGNGNAAEHDTKNTIDELKTATAKAETDEFGEKVNGTN